MSAEEGGPPSQYGRLTAMMGSHACCRLARGRLSCAGEARYPLPDNVPGGINSAEEAKPAEPVPSVPVYRAVGIHREVRPTSWSGFLS